jgi:hypothetical protein
MQVWAVAARAVPAVIVITRSTERIARMGIPAILSAAESAGHAGMRNRSSNQLTSPA